MDIIPKYIEQLLNLPVATQFKLAERLASNCGYKLTEEDKHSLEIKEAIAYYKVSKTKYADLVVQGLERLL